MKQTNKCDLKFGVNYVPSKDWFFSWQNFNYGAVDEDLAAIASLGADHIRMHLRWDLFHPNNYFVSMPLLLNLRNVLDIAEKYNLKAEVTALDGWMSGFWFLPSFIKSANIITDANMISAEKYFFRKLASVIADHPALMGIDIGNELNMYGYGIKNFTVEEGDAWLKDIFAEVKALFPNKINVIGVDHQPWYGDAYFSRRTLTNSGSATSLHSWVKFTDALRYGIFSEESLTLQEFNVELANAYACDTRRKVWIQEFGISPQWTEKENFERFVYESMLNATRSENLMGFTFWCSHDIDRKFVFDEIEYDLGLFDVNNRIKPLGKIYAEAVKKIRSGEKPKPLKGGKAYIIDESRPFDGWEYARKFSGEVRRGNHVKFVLSSDSDDAEYLKSRGITEIVR